MIKPSSIWPRQFLGGLSLLAVTSASCQMLGWGGGDPPQDRPVLVNPELDEKLKGMLQFDVPLIGADSLAARRDDFITFDARTAEEFTVSHIPGSIRIDPDGSLPPAVEALDRDRPIVVYCSVGYRSEKVARHLQQNGFSNVANLYGSLFDWADRGLPLIDEQGRPTQRIHTYNRRWGKLVSSPALDKVW